MNEPGEKNDDNYSWSSSSDEEDEGDLVLEGVLVRNPDASDSSSSDDDSDSSDDDDAVTIEIKKDYGCDSKHEIVENTNPLAKKQKIQQDVNPRTENNIKQDTKNGDKNGRTSKTKTNAVKQSSNQKVKKPNKKNKKKTKNNRGSEGPEIIPIEFTFCEMDEKFFWGVKALLVSSSPVYLPMSTNLTETMIANVAKIGTVVSTMYEYEEGAERDPEYDNMVYGFASVLSVSSIKATAENNNKSSNSSSSSNNRKECVEQLKKICLDKCPESHKSEVEHVLSGKTKRPAGFLIHCRMVNVPLEIVDILHQQLVLDMDYAVDNVLAQGGTEEQRKSLDYGAFVRIAPTYREKSTNGKDNPFYFKYFDDEIFANHSEFTYEIELPKTYGMEETPYCTVMVMTKTGYRAALKNLKEMVNGGV